MLCCPTTIMSNTYRPKPIRNEMTQQVKTPFAKLKDLRSIPRIPCQKTKANSGKMLSLNTMVFPLATIHCPSLAGQQVLGILPCKFYLSSGLCILTTIPAFSHGSGELKFRSTFMRWLFINEAIGSSAFTSVLIHAVCHLSHLSCSRKGFHLMSSTSPLTTVSLVIFSMFMIR